MQDPNKSPEENQNNDAALPYLTENFHEEEHADDSDEDQEDLSELNAEFDDDGGLDDSLDDIEDDDFYDLGEFSEGDDDYGDGGNSGF